MIRGLLGATLLVSVAVAQVAVAAQGGFWQSKDSKDKDTYVKVPMPPGVQVILTELEGPVFANAEGKTLYTWGLRGLRSGQAGDRRNSGEATCDGTIYQETTGFMSPYPGGFLLPELDKRRSCEQLWPPLLAPADAKPLGKWTIAKRTNGESQWAYNGYPVYTSDRDHKPGDVLGGTDAVRGGEQGVLRYPLNPPLEVPPELAVQPTRTGHMVVDHKGYSVFSSDADEPGKSNCTGQCLDDWAPVLAPPTKQVWGEWSVIERSPGVQQWALRGKALYTDRHAERIHAYVGDDVPGWHNVFMQRALPPPAEFTVQDSRIGQVLADANGKTIYLYQCTDDAKDQQSCDYPDAPQVYRLAICGKFDPKICQETFPYVPAKAGAKADSSLWTTMMIDPNTGHRAEAGQSGAILVWAYRERPVFTYGGDKKPGDADGDNFGEFNGARNGFRAFWVRDDFHDNSMGSSDLERDR
jgi:predicted lipoprotein with Yx(FWY)xxD motif